MTTTARTRFAGGPPAKPAQRRPGAPAIHTTTQGAREALGGLGDWEPARADLASGGYLGEGCRWAGCHHPERDE